jgi:hypothetical protein
MSTPALFELSNLLNTLMVGRYLRWKEQLDTAGTAYQYTGAPLSASYGVYLENSPRTRLCVSLRTDVHRRTVWVTEDNHVAGQTYTVTVDGTAVAYASGGGDSWADVLDGLVAALPGVPAADALVTFTAEDLDSDGTNETLVVRGKAEADYTFDASATGAATVGVQADPNTATFRTYAYYAAGTPASGSSSPSAWQLHEDAVTIGYRGHASDMYDSAGWGRAYLEGYDLDGPAGDGASVTYDFAYLAWGPAVREDSDASS